MRPVKRKELIKKTAEIMELPEELVEKVVEHYYTSLQKKMSRMKEMGIYVPSLGIFVVKKKRLENKIINHRNILKDTAEKDMSILRYEILMKKKENLERMEAMLIRLTEQEQVKKEFKESDP